MEVGFQYSLSIKTSTLLKPFRQQKRDIDIALNGAFKSFGLFSNTICKSLMNRLHSTLFVDQLKSYNRCSVYISQSSPLVQRIWTSRTILLLDNKFCLHPTQHSLYGQLTYSLFIYAAAPSIQYGHGTLVKQGVDCLQSMQPVPKIYVFSYSQTNVNANLLQIEHSDASRPNLSPSISWALLLPDVVESKFESIYNTFHWIVRSTKWTYINCWPFYSYM